MFGEISQDKRRFVHNGHYHAILLNDKYQKVRRKLRIDQNQIASDEPFYGFKVIKMNSNYIEVVDSSFDGYGKDITILMIYFSAVFVLFTWGNYVLLLDTIKNFDASALVFMPFIWLMSIGFYALIFMLLRVYYLRELRSYTYRPIRFNCTNGKVYAFDEFGEVHVSEWKRMMFVPTKVGTYFTPQKHEMQGFMYSPDGQGYSHVIRFAIGFHREYCLSQWEYIRRYMQDGAAQFMPNKAGFQAGRLGEDEAYKLWYCIDIDGKRETPKVSWEVIQLHNMHNIQGPTAKYIIYGMLYLFRRLMMRVAKVPHWPQWVEDECKVAPNDPYIVTAENSVDTEQVFDVIIATRDNKKPPHRS